MPVANSESLTHTADEEKARREAADLAAFPPDSQEIAFLNDREMPTGGSRSAMQEDTYEPGRRYIEDEPMITNRMDGGPDILIDRRGIQPVPRLVYHQTPPPMNMIQIGIFILLLAIVIMIAVKK
ncbi:hypothetical protein EMVG_00114 [Emiliania huxleyi virus PS401]|jgi:hypothetical protein|nr:hypothetical protein EMVG_00114 [Emiliania huxleyi virus PS401]